MLNVPIDVIVQKIKDEKGLDDAEIESRIKVKLEQLAGLISREGAAHIVANELGVRVMPKSGGRVKISEVLAGMRDVEVVGKVTAVYEVREFSRAEGSGKVGNFMLADETGSIRIVCWGGKADAIAELTEGMIVKIGSAYVRENQGRVEIHCNDRTQLLPNPAGEVVGEVKVSQRIEAARKKINELTENDANAELLGTITQIFDPRFFEVCAMCQKRVKALDGTMTCQEHGPIAIPDFSYVTNIIIDDNTGRIRAVFFRNQAQRLTNKSHEQMLFYKENPAAFEDVKTDLLGNLIKVTGRVQRNSMTADLEFVSQLVFLNPNLEAELLR
ncbi:hypothetical protein HY641_03975 [Candidatus Woesearchaeota archaeon]|nr:hypothetical protein [Candidatus Woesearchaeota archaeon]